MNAIYAITQMIGSWYAMDFISFILKRCIKNFPVMIPITNDNMMAGMHI